MTTKSAFTGARRADVTGLGAWEPPCRGIGTAKIRRKRQSQRQQGRHPVDVGLMRENYENDRREHLDVLKYTPPQRRRLRGA
jgi:hypothetical protein